MVQTTPEWNPTDVEAKDIVDTLKKEFDLDDGQVTVEKTNDGLMISMKSSFYT